MSDPESMADRRSVMLGELAELGLGLARDLQRRALEAEAADEAARLADAFHRVARSVRQSLALEARLARDARRDVEGSRAAAGDASRAAVRRREAVLTEALERVVWTECEREEAESHARCLGMYIDEELGRPGFVEDPIEAVVRRICEDIELPNGAPGDLAEICRAAEAEVDAAARRAAARGAPAPPAAGLHAPPASRAGPAWRSSA